MDIDTGLRDAVDNVFGFLPNLTGFLVILVVGYLVTRVATGLTGRTLQRAGLDRRLRESRVGGYVDTALPGFSPSAALRQVVLWLLAVFFLSSAVGALGVPALTRSTERVLEYLPHVVGALVIFVVAALLAGTVGGAVTRVLGDTPTGRVVAAVVPALVMVVALFMILTQLQLAPAIVQIAFAATLGALALALALAFGLGGRSVAEQVLQEAYARSRETRSRPRPQPPAAAEPRPQGPPGPRQAPPTD